TGSGKTLVYIRLIQETLKLGRKAIVLVPEIALTPQLLATFAAYFGESIAVLHSALGIGERYDEWKRIRSGEVDVVIGTRSAIFAPLENIGLIVLDEEQEYTYKSESSPRYHARDIAKYRCTHSDALLLLGSATPDVESMYAAEEGKYKLFRIRGRFNTAPLPQVTIADMKKDLKDGGGGMIGSVLRAELEENFSRGEQSILFINRRGTSTLVACGECGYTFTCPRCSVSITYHAANGRFMCHYCGYSESATSTCPDCGGRLKFIGAGTQKIEEELSELFPGIEMIRMDLDTVSAMNSHEKLLSRFRNEKVPILLGTQMVTKGLDFENVTLVGVLSADQMLYINDFRAHERTFSLITQVVGRSGRGSKPGRAVIQTLTPENEILRLAANQDYDTFYSSEIELRKLSGTPPVKDLYTLTVSGLDAARVQEGCQKLRSALIGYLSDVPDAVVLGPAPAPVAKVNNRFRFVLTLSCIGSKRIRNTISHLIREFSRDPYFKNNSVYADLNPYH
ncbi:MAG: primosomal protein N', partial [Oscillospiraceae bacterium]|nr:primosomal protein N' [Oscillospiraceae bacterium]